MANMEGQGTGRAISREGRVTMERHTVCTIYKKNLVFDKNKGQLWSYMWLMHHSVTREEKSNWTKGGSVSIY